MTCDNPWRLASREKPPADTHVLTWWHGLFVVAWYSLDKWWDDEGDEIYVTHWRPLPAPPEPTP